VLNKSSGINYGTPGKATQRTPQKGGNRGRGLAKTQGVSPFNLCISPGNRREAPTKTMGGNQEGDMLTPEKRKPSRELLKYRLAVQKEMGGKKTDSP